ncbi:MAG TPA: Rieske (2Fe-2S) protein [Solirubrobacteraceae bacterium]|nr:Rieske (2Fe-2S) protein [Solirubrobacteraceae bacterium]
MATQARDVQRYRVCPLNEIPEPGGVMVDIGDREIGVFRHEAQVYAYDNRCIHQGGPVCSGELVGVTRRQLGAGGQAIGDRLDEHEMRLVCPWHGWEYDLATGEVAHDRRRRLRSFPVTVEDGVVYVDA